MSGAALDKLIRALRLAGLEFSADDLADALWLAPRLPRRTDALESLRRAMEPGSAPPPPPQPPERPDGTGQEPPPDDRRGVAPAPEATQQEGVDVLPGPTAIPGDGLQSVQVRLPDAAGLPDALAMARALRPLRRRRSTTRFFRLDEPRTAERLAAGDVWLPVLVPGQERWLSAALVIDAGASMAIWQTMLGEFQHLLETLGAFRMVEWWWLDTEDAAWTLEPDGLTPLFASQRSHLYRRPLDVVDASGRRLILVVSDCVSDAWWDGRVARLLRLWGRCNHTAIVQILPRNMWERTALGPAEELILRSPRAACPNAYLLAFSRTRLRGLRKVSRPGAIPMPILNFDAATLKAWSRWVAQDAGGILPGRLFESGPTDTDSGEDDAWMQGIGQPFLTLASRPARKLANIMAVAPPFNLPLLRVIRESMLRGEGTQVHEAEFLLGGLVKIIAGADLRVRRPDEVFYDFRSEGLRKTLRAAVRIPDALKLLSIERVSRYLGQRLGQPDDFPAYLASPEDYEGALPLGPVASNDPIARFTSDILQWFGEPYAGLLRPSTTSRAPFTPPGPPEPEPFQPPRLRIRVVGSPATLLRESFDEFCNWVGRELGRRRHTLVIADTEQADGPALTGYASAFPQGHVIYVRRLERSQPDLAFDSPLQVSLVQSDDPYGAGALAFADAVIAIGGATNTQASCEFAFARRMPLFAVRDFGGTAAAYHASALAALEGSGFELDRTAQLAARVSPDLPSAIMHALEAWYVSRQQELATQTGRVVCRVVGPASRFGTGFLVGPGILVTTHHVLPDTERALGAHIQFEDEVVCDLAPHEFFATDEARDFTVVALAPNSEGGELLKSRGTLSLMPSRPALEQGHRVMMAYRSDARPMRLAVGEVLEVSEHSVRFRAETEQGISGASGAPVFNSTGDLVALLTRELSASEGGLGWLVEGTRIQALADALARADTPPVRPKPEARPSLYPLHQMQFDGIVVDMAWAPRPELILAAGGTGSRVNLYNFESGERVDSWPRRPDDVIFALAWRPDGVGLVRGARDGKIRQYKYMENERFSASDKAVSIRSAVNVLAWAPDRRSPFLACGSNDGKIRLIDSNYRVVRQPEGHKDWVLALSWTRVGSRLVSGGRDGKIIFWTLEGGSQLREIRRIQVGSAGSPDSVIALAWSPDGKSLAAACESGVILIWFPDDREWPLELKGHIAAVTSVAYSHDGRLLASKSFDGTVRLWDTATNEQVYQHEEPANEKYYSTVTFHPAHPILATLGKMDREIRIWGVRWDGGGEPMGPEQPRSRQRSAPETKRRGNNPRPPGRS